MSLRVAPALLHRSRQLRPPRIEPLLASAFAVLVALLILALFGARLAPHEPIFFVVEHGDDPRPYDPGVVFPFGSDVLGRDVLSLVLSGAGTTLLIVLVAGAARVVAGVAVAALTGWWRPARLVTEWTAQLVAAVPATLVALVIVKVLVRADTSVLVFIGALLVLGWVGPYRVIRAEVDRLSVAPFTIGAIALGVSRWRLLWRHQLPHLVPVIAMNLSQQIVASLVLVAELGVLGAFVGQTRTINIEESLSKVWTGQVNAAQIADPPEWGGLLASARTVEALWTTRWLIFVPGVAFALTALAVSFIGYALARRYATRDVIAELRTPAAGLCALVLAALVVVSALVPQRYAAATHWADAARTALTPVQDVPAAFAGAGLAPVGENYAITNTISSIAQTGPERVAVGSVELVGPWPRVLVGHSDETRQLRSFVVAGTGGGTVSAPLVFAGRGINFDDYKPQQTPLGIAVPPPDDFGQLIRDYQYADDYAGIDVRGKIVVLVRALGIRGRRGEPPFSAYAYGPNVDDQIANAVRRGAAGVIFVDPALSLYNDLPASFNTFSGEYVGGMNPYLRAERERPPTRTDGVPVVVVTDSVGIKLLSPLGVDIRPLLHVDERGDVRWQTSLSRDLGTSARIDVPLRLDSATTTSYAAEVPSRESAGHVVVWNVRGTADSGSEVLADLAKIAGPAGTPFVLVDFDPAIDYAANARLVRQALGDRRIALVVALGKLTGNALNVTTRNGDLILAFDRYADAAQARHHPTLVTERNVVFPGSDSFLDTRVVLIEGDGNGDSDLRPDAAALLGYLTGRMVLGSEETPR